jgi:phosphinothricin acetyltransferase
MMADVATRAATIDDLERIVEIYNYYVINTPITFDLVPAKPEDKIGWFRDHCDGARHRMLVAIENDRIIGFAGTGVFRERAAYDTTVETTIYCDYQVTGRGFGATMYRALFEMIANEDVNRIVAGITLPNDASVRLHRSFGFTDVGIFTEVGRKFDRYWDVVWMERPLKL